MIFIFIGYERFSDFSKKTENVLVFLIVFIISMGMSMHVLKTKVNITIDHILKLVSPNLYLVVSPLVLFLKGIIC